MPTRRTSPRRCLCRRTLAILCVVAGAAACRRSAIQPPGPLPGGAAAEREVVAAAERLFEGMRARDTASLRASLAPDLVIVASRESGDGASSAVRRQGVDDFLRAVATSAPGELRERIWSPEVRVDGAVATLWAPYDFHRGERFSHCGHDAFQFARTNGRWLVTGLAYTVRTSPCAPPAG